MGDSNAHGCESHVFHGGVTPNVQERSHHRRPSLPKKRRNLLLIHEAAIEEGQRLVGFILREPQGSGVLFQNSLVYRIYLLSTWILHTWHEKVTYLGGSLGAKQTLYLLVGKPLRDYPP